MTWERVWVVFEESNGEVSNDGTFYTFHGKLLSKNSKKSKKTSRRTTSAIWIIFAYPTALYHLHFPINMHCSRSIWIVNIIPGDIINDMQVSIYNMKHWHELSHSLHFVRHEGDLATHPPSPASKSGSRLPIHVINSACLGLAPVEIDSSYLLIMSWITIPRDEYYTILSIGFSGWPNHIAVVAAF